MSEARDYVVRLRDAVSRRKEPMTEEEEQSYETQFEEAIAASVSEAALDAVVWRVASEWARIHLKVPQALADVNEGKVAASQLSGGQRTVAEDDLFHLTERQERLYEYLRRVGPEKAIARMRDRVGGAEEDGL